MKDNKKRAHKPTYNEALEYCIQHYVNRGYARKDARDYVENPDKERIFWIYEKIKEEENEPHYEHKSAFILEKE